MKKKNNTKKKIPTAEAVATELVDSLDSFSTDIEYYGTIVSTSNEPDNVNSRASGEVC